MELQCSGLVFLLTLICTLNYVMPVRKQNLNTDYTQHSDNSTSYEDQITEITSQVSHHKADEIQVGCKEIRSKRYISDGFCTSIKPITEVVCTGHCLPIRELPWYAEFVKVWAKTKTLEWRCVNDVTRRKRVKLLCAENGEIRHYRIKVVESCKCKRYHPTQNRSITRVQTKSKSGRSRARKNTRRSRKRKT